MPWSKPKASSTARGYGTAHRAEAVRRAALMTPWSPCSACGQPLGPQYGTTRNGRRLSLWHLPHTADRSGYLAGLQHARCNVSEGASRGAAISNARRKATPQRWS